MSKFRKVIAVGLDGLDATLTESLLDRGELPHLSRLRASGAYTRLKTTYPAQTPVAWSSFATGTNPGGHGVYDFIRRDPSTYRPDFSLNRYEQKNAFVPPKAVNLRRGTPVWQVLSSAGVPSVVIRCPCTFPPDEVRGRMLGGMGVPDIRGGLGTSTFYTTAPNVEPRESEIVVPLALNGTRTITTHIVGPRNPRTGADYTTPLTVTIDRENRKATLQVDGGGAAVEVRVGGWSPWLKVRWKTGLLQAVRGMVRFYLVALDPHVELYASPVNFDPEAPLFPISAPADYARELATRLGGFYTTGMVEDHGGLNNGRFDEAAYLDQCESVMRERERMLELELDRFDRGFLYCLFDTPDRVQHMCWRFREPGHPANREAGPAAAEYAQAVEDQYRRCDALVGRVLERVDDETLLLVLSDHGFSSFQRGVHLNTWLHDNGFLALERGMEPGDHGDFLRHVDWGRTRAYALGIGSIYLNLAGREANGIVSAHEADQIALAIKRGLTGLVDEERGTVAIRDVMTRREIYAGPFAGESPDLVVCFSPGYRASWGTALGAVPRGHFEDNTKRWSGDHIIDPSLVPGVLFANRPLAAGTPGIVDLAPTILAALGAPRGDAMEGKSLLA